MAQEKEVKIRFSHSSLKDFENCARRFHEVKVLKKYPFQETEQTRYGTEVHAAIENYIRNETPLPPQFKAFQPVVDAVLSKEGRRFPELEMAVTKDLEPCAWDHESAWARGISDLTIVNDDNLTAWVVDWKTGNDRYPDRDQLVLMSLMTFIWFPHVRKVNSALLFIVKGSMVKMQMRREQAETFWWKYRERIARLEASYTNNVWNPNRTPLCGWCQVVGCEFNPKH